MSMPTTTPAEQHDAITQHTPAKPTARVVRFHETGGAEVLQIEELPLPEPGHGEVRLRVKAIGLNRAEVLYRRGKYLYKTELPGKNGYEASGVVEAIGIGVSQTWLGKVVSTVPAFHLTDYGVYGEVAVMPVSALAAYPATLTPEEGASIWMQYFTAWGALCYLGKLTKGDFVLIPAASSSVGLAAIELCRVEGATSIALTRTEEKRQALLDAGADHVIVRDTENMVERVNAITGGKGCRLIFDAVVGPMIDKKVSITAPGGTIFLYGGLSGEPANIPLFAMIAKGVSLRGYSLFEMTIEDQAARTAGEAYIYKHLASGALKPKIDKVFPFEQIADAQRYMEASNQVGKIVVSVP